MEAGLEREACEVPVMPKAVGDTRVHEADFCAQVASYANAVFAASPELPFGSARIEGFGHGAQRRKRKDLRFYDRAGQLALCGEVKLPGTAEGRSPYDDKLVRDAHQKADDARVRYFFTWNVNAFVLWDRQLWDVPLLERRVREWQLDLHLASAEDVGRAEVLDHIQRRFLPALLADIADIYTGRRPDWPMPPDDLFIRSLESHLHWPVQLTRDWLAREADRNRGFDSRLQEWMAGQDWTFVRGAPEEWRAALDRAARSLAYILVNRLIFYKALRDRFADLPRLQLAGSVRTPDAAYRSLQGLFERAVRRSGDYEPLFYPHEKDWASRLLFEAPGALDAWRGVLRGIETYDFKSIPSDVVGRIFQRLISPEERHRYGQHFTGDDVVDLINAFCIRTADATVLDPACGSGSFLVRAYYRKRAKEPAKSHLELLAELFGCDIALYPAHLAILNLAAREINEEANYPRVVRKDFFDVKPSVPFCTIPAGPRGGDLPVLLPELDAVVGNPPYVRQEKVPRKAKETMAKLAASAWPGLRLSGRSDAHCYFWPAATRLLKEDGYFGFLTSSSWLDVEYGFALQAWVLQNFKILAILESAAEPWFPEARVKTCVTILERCNDEVARMAARVKFVRFSRPLAAILGAAAGEDEGARQLAVDRLRERIETATGNEADDALRIIVKTQGDLWRDGLRAGRILGHGPAPEPAGEGDGEEDEGQAETASILGGPGTYRAGKWGRYVRAPDFYFEVMREFGARFVPLGEIAETRFGVKTGCDAFFMPHDVTTAALAEHPDAREFKRRFGVERELVRRGRVKIVKAGDGSLHPVEAQYVAPEVHSLMEIDRPVVRASSLDRVVLLVDKPLAALRGTWVAHYLRYGETHQFPSKKSRPVPVPLRSTCAARDPWYDLTKLVRPGLAFWPMAQQYRHIIPSNPDALVCNHNLFDLAAENLSEMERLALVAVLNSTLVGLFKTFYGRFAGTEGNLKTEVVDVNLLEVPDPRAAAPEVAGRLIEALQRLATRAVGRLVEEGLMNCHSPERARKIASGPIVLSDELRQPDRRALDEAVFELLGVAAPGRRNRLVDRLYEETARHFRQIRVVEIQKMEQRSVAAARRFTADELAADAWDAMDPKDLRTLSEWLSAQPGPMVTVTIPVGGKATLIPEPDMFNWETVYFGKGRRGTHLVCASRAQAELVARLANLGVCGDVGLPAEETSCRRLLVALDSRLAEARVRFEALASSRTGTEKLREDVVDLLMYWFVHGRPGPHVRA